MATKKKEVEKDPEPRKDVEKNIDEEVESPASVFENKLQAKLQNLENQLNQANNIIAKLQANIQQTTQTRDMILGAMEVCKELLEPESDDKQDGSD